MSICDDELAGILAAIEENFAWRCRALPDGRRVEITTSRTTANSEPMTLLAVLDDGMLTVSDGGDTINRLADAEFDLADSVLGALWGEALRTYRLYETEGRVFIQTPISEAPYALNRFADALVALDSLRLLGSPSPSRSKTLADEVSDTVAMKITDSLGIPYLIEDEDGEGTRAITLDELYERLAGLRTTMDALDNGAAANGSRDYGRGIAYAVREMRKAAVGTAGGGE